MNTYSATKLWNFGKLLKERDGTWFAATSTDEWEEFIEKHEITTDQEKIIRQGFDGTPFPKNPDIEIGDILMPFGNHKDKPISKVPIDYLLYIRKQEWIVKWPTVLDWLTRNKTKLDTEEKETNEANEELKQFGKSLLK